MKLSNLSRLSIYSSMLLTCVIEGSALANNVPNAIPEHELPEIEGLPGALSSDSTHAYSCGNVLIYGRYSQYQSAIRAANNLGLSFHNASNEDFVDLLESQPWSLVLMDIPSTEPTSDWQAALINHIAAGGSAIHSHWNSVSLTTSLQESFEVNALSPHNTVSFYQWGSGSSMFNGVPTIFDDWSDLWGINGFYLEPTGSAISPAGFTPSPEINQSAIVIGNGGKTIFNGFLFDDFYPADKDADGVKDIVELLQNQIMSVCALEVAIDIKPGSDSNCFNINDHGVIPVSILGSDAFDVTNIDPGSLNFNGLGVRVRGNKGPLCNFEDANGDDYLDMVCQFEDNAEYWSLGSDIANVTGQLYSGASFQGSDSICVVPE